MDCREEMDRARLALEAALGRRDAALARGDKAAADLVEAVEISLLAAMRRFWLTEWLRDAVGHDVGQDRQDEQDILH